jgi:hypothetical protein
LATFTGSEVAFSPFTFSRSAPSANRLACSAASSDATVGSAFRLTAVTYTFA